MTPNGISAPSNGKMPGIAVAIPGELFVFDPFQKFFDANEQGGQDTGFDQETHQHNDDYRQKVGRRQLLIGGEIRIQKVDRHKNDGYTK